MGVQNPIATEDVVPSSSSDSDDDEVAPLPLLDVLSVGDSELGV